MPARKPIDKKTLVAASVDAAKGLSIRRLMRKYPEVSERVLRVLTQNGVGVDEWRAALSRELQTTAGEALLELREAIRERRINPNTLPVTVGVLIDKVSGIEDRNTVKSANIAVQVNSHIYPLSKEEILDILEGKKRPPANPSQISEYTRSKAELLDELAAAAQDPGVLPKNADTRDPSLRAAIAPPDSAQPTP